MIVKLKQLGKNTIIYGVGSSLQKFISLLLLPFFTYYINPEGYGVLAIIGIVSMVVLPLFSLGFGSAIGISYFKSRSQKRKNASIWTAFFILLGSILFAYFMFLSFQEFVLKITLLDAQYATILHLGILGALFSIIATPFMLKLQFDNRAKLYVVVSFSSSFLTAFLSIFMVVYLEYGIYGIVISQLVGNIFIFTIVFILTFKNTIIIYSQKIQKELLKNGIPLIPSFAFLFILMHSNKYIMQSLEGLEIVGIYSIGFSLGSAISIVTSAVATAWFPFFMSYINKQKEAEIIFGKVFTYYVFVVGFICLLFFIFAKPVAILLLDEKYYESYRVIGMVATAYYLLGMFNMFLPGIYFAQKVRMVTSIQLFASVLSIPLYYVFIDNFSLFGMGYSLLLGHILLVALSYLYVVNNNLINVKYEWIKLLFFSLFFCFNILIVFIETNYKISKFIFIFILQITFVIYLLKKLKGVRDVKSI